jgi:hypothetical protein
VIFKAIQILLRPDPPRIFAKALSQGFFIQLRSTVPIFDESPVIASVVIDMQLIR